MSSYRASPRRHKLMALAVSSLFTAPVLAEESEAEADSRLPRIEVSGQRSHYDPRPASVGTATRTEARERDVPQVVDSISVEQTMSYGGRDLADALAGVPGVSNVSDTRFDAFRLRGFSNAGDLLLDGMRDDAQYVRGLGNIERIEVLKGPAAVLYGRGGGGGVINRISKQPGREAFASVSTSWGSFGRLGVAADINRPLGEQWSMRINVGRERADSFRREVDSTRQYVAPSLKWEDGRSSWLLQAEYQQSERVPDRGMPAQVSRSSASGAPLAYRLPPASSDTFYGAAGRDFVRDTNLNLRSSFSHRLDASWQVRQSMSLLDLDSRFDNTFVTQPYVSTPRDFNRVQRARFVQHMQQRNLQTNLELQGQIKGAAISHDLLIGAEYSWQRREPRLWAGAAAPVALHGPDTRPGGGAANRPFASNSHRATGQALYVQDQLSLGQQWKLLAGLRWDRFGIDSTNRLRHLRSQRSSSVLSPRIGVVWEALPGHSLYASTSKNFAPVGGDTIGITPDARGNANDLGPQYSKQLETGLKSDWLDGRLSSTLSWFQLDLYNRAVADPVVPTMFYLTGLERNRGVELSVKGELARHWFIRSGVTRQNARIVEAEQRFTGKRSTGVSGTGGSLFIGFAPPQGMFAEGGVVHEGARYADRDNLLELPGYVRWDGKIGYRLRQAEITLAAINLTNRGYVASATGLAQIMPGAPRSVTLTMAYRF